MVRGLGPWLEAREGGQDDDMASNIEDIYARKDIVEFSLFDQSSESSDRLSISKSIFSSTFEQILQHQEILFVLNTNGKTSIQRSTFLISRARCVCERYEPLFHVNWTFRRYLLSQAQRAVLSRNSRPSCTLRAQRHTSQHALLSRQQPQSRV